MDVKGKYLKDKSGNIISPVTSIDTVYLDDTNIGQGTVTGRVFYTIAQ